MPEKKEDTMKLWNAVCTTKPSDTKKFKGKGGFQGTAICAQSQRRVATGQWGPFGGDWGITDETYGIEKLGDDFHNWILVYRGTLYYPGGKFGICSDIDLFTYSHKYKSWSRNNDPCKKARTDALTKGLSELGFNADVFLGLYDDNKYVAERQAEEQGPPADAPPPAETPPPATPPVNVEKPAIDAIKQKMRGIFGDAACFAAKARVIDIDGNFIGDGSIKTLAEAQAFEAILNKGTDNESQ